MVKFKTRGLPPGTHRTGPSHYTDTVEHTEVPTSAGNQTPVPLPSQSFRDLERAARGHTRYSGPRSHTHKYQTPNLFSPLPQPARVSALYPNKIGPINLSHCHRVPNN